MTRPFRFAAELHEPLPGSTWADSARELEALGYSTLFVPDHFDEGLGPLTAMAAAAAVTTSLRVGSLVFDCDFRHPAVLARELATIDLLSDGRLEVGLGAGWKRLDYDRSGIPMDRPGVRVDRMIEHATILRALFAEESVTFEGEHYRITDLPGSPRPATPGGPPFLIGGGASRVLRFAGSFADIVGVNPSIHSGEIDSDAARDALPERIDQKVAWMQEGAAGREVAPEVNAWIAVAQITDDAPSVAAVLADFYGASPDEVLAAPMSLVGTVAELADRLRERRERWGYSYVTLPGAEARTFAPLVAELAGT